METPLSTKRITRSQTKAATTAAMNSVPISRKNEEPESKQRNGISDRSALIDITNDSPIVGLAMGSLKTPSSFAKKKDISNMMTPGSGEALLRREVKTLLQKVEEEAEISKISFENRLFLHLEGVVDSSSGVRPPCPMMMNTIYGNSVKPSEVVEAEFRVPQVVERIDGSKKEKSLESEKGLISRSLLFDFSEKSETSESSICSSVGSVSHEHQSNDDDGDGDDIASSVWSIRVNNKTSTQFKQEEDEEEDDDDDQVVKGGELLIDELCEGVSKISVNEKKIPDFEGKHTRFVYNSEDEIEGEEEDVRLKSPSILHLKGLPKPAGKHLRFSNEEEEED